MARKNKSKLWHQRRKTEKSRYKPIYPDYLNADVNQLFIPKSTYKKKDAQDIAIEMFKTAYVDYSVYNNIGEL